MVINNPFMAGVTYGFSRFDNEEYIDSLKSAGVDNENMFIAENAEEGAVILRKLLLHVNDGDIIYIPSIYSAVISTQQLIKLVEDLALRGVILKSVKETWLDSSSPQILKIFMDLLEFEKSVASDIESNTLKQAEEAGVKYGRQLSKKADIKLAIEMYKEGRHSLTKIAEICNISRTTLWRRIKDLQEQGAL